MENNKSNHYKQLKKFLNTSNKLMKQYFIYIDDLSNERYFEYDSLYKIDFEARKFLVSLQDWCHETNFDFDELWSSDLNLFEKIKPVINEIFNNFKQTIFYELEDVSLNSDNFEGYYYFVNMYKVFILLPYMVASCMLKNNKVSLNKLAFVLSNSIQIYECFDAVIDRVKTFSEQGKKKLLFSNFSFESFFELLDNLSNLALYITMNNEKTKKLVFKSRFFNWKGITLFSSFGVVMIVLIIILVIKFS